MLNYYEVLGVPRNASLELIKKTYAGLTKIYHPDIYTGDKTFATEKLKQINLAYDVLSSMEKRQQHDEELNANGTDDDIFGEDFDEDADETYSIIIKKDWDFACEFYPELDKTYEYLRNFSKSLALVYQIKLIEEKSFENFYDIAMELEFQFLKTKFGEEPKIVELARASIINGYKKFALDLNRALKVLGEGSIDRILNNLKTKHPEFANKFYSEIRGFNAEDIWK